MRKNISLRPTENVPETYRTYDAKYDFFKFALSLLVVAIHSQLYPMILYPWLRIAVPLFFVISSYFLFSKLHTASADRHKSILKKFVSRNLLLYLCWFVILLPITVYLRRKIYFSGNFIQNTLAITKSILFGSTFVASWFITATVIGVILIYVLSRKIKNDWIMLLISAIVFCFVTLASSYKSAIENTVLSTIIDKYVGIFGGLACSFPAAIFWVFIGKLFAEQQIKIKSLPLLMILIACSCVALFWEWKFVISLNGSYNNDSYFMLAPLCVLLFIFIEKLNPTYRKSSVYFKRMSTVIYVVHGSLIPIVSKVISIVFKTTIPPLSFIITLIGCVVIYFLIELAIKKCCNERLNKILKLLY